MPAPTILPLTPERWPDLEALFGPRGACAGCWDMWWRLPRSAFERGLGEGNREAFRSLVLTGAVPGLLAYLAGEPAGWCAVQPRDAYPSLSRSRILKPVDDQPVWSITCFYTAKAHRGKGLTVDLLRAAVDYACHHGAHIIEGYPIEPAHGRVANTAAFHGTAVAFRAAGFVEVARRSATRPIMRITLGATQTP